MASPPMQIPLDRDDALRHLRTLLLVDIQYHQEAYVRASNQDVTQHAARLGETTYTASAAMDPDLPPAPAPCSICVGVALYVHNFGKAAEINALGRSRSGLPGPGPTLVTVGLALAQSRR